MMGRGHVNLEDDYSGPFSAEVSDGRDTHCELSGVWSTSEDLVEITAECWDNVGRSGAYEVVAARF
ncbi:MAG: hypothetical protein QGG40_14390 [Myxococcota bacterium]|nr:hypothetical protein [Myxococcota bacterium]